MPPSTTFRSGCAPKSDAPRPDAPSPTGAPDPPPSPRLLGQALRGLRITGILTALKTVLDLGGQLALARLLAPGAFGVFGFAQGLSGFVSCFTDLAGQKYIIQKRGELDRETVDSVFTFELLLGVLVGGVWAVGSGALLTALGRPEQIPFARCLALWIVLERLMFPRALLDRRMAFGRSNLALVLGTFAAVATMLIAALSGAGAYTFVAGLLVRTGVSAAFLWLWAPMRPRLALRWTHVAPLVRFGGPILLTSVLIFYYTNVDYIIVQVALGYSALGLYYAAYRYPHYIHQVQHLVSTVVYPAFTKASDLGQLARGFSMVTKYSAAIGILPVLVVWVLGEDAVRALLSSKWTAATFCFQMFTLLAVMRMASAPWYDVYVSRGRTRPMPFIAAANAVATTAAACVGVRWAGIEGAAVLVTAASMLSVLFCCNVLLKRMLAVRYLDILRIPLTAGAVAGWLGFFVARRPWIAHDTGGGAGLFLDFLLRAGMIAVVYAAVFLALDWRNLLSIRQRARR